jgi:hypothetical protein
MSFPTKEEIVAKETAAVLQLNEDKVIRGKKFPAGTVIAEMKCAEGFNAEDVDLAVQLDQAKVIPVAPSKK